MPTSATIYPSSSSNWTNSSNANAADGVFAQASTTTELLDTTPPSYLRSPTTNLVCQTFTNLNSGINAGDTITGVTVKIAVKNSNGASCLGTIYLARGGVKIGNTKTVNINGTATEYTFGGAGDTWGGTWVGSDLTSLQVVFFAKDITGSAGDTIYVDYVNVSVIYTASTPNAFTFTDITSATINTLYTSNSITVSGLGGGMAAVSVSGAGQYEKNNSGVWTSGAGTALDGDTFRLRETSSGAANTAVNTTLTIGGVSDTYTVTTVGPDTTPDAFGWASSSGVERSTVCYASTAVTVSGINAAAAISISGGSGQYSINGGAYTTGSGTVNNGDVIRVQATSSGSFSTGVTTTVTIGGVTGTFTATTRAADTIPDQFTWTDQLGATTSTSYNSNTITISGLEAAAALSFVTSGGSAHKYQINGGGFTSVGSTTISNGDTLQLQMTSPGSSNQVGNIAVTIGGISDTYSVSTGADTVPDAFTFTDVTDGIPGYLYTTSPITLSGMTPAVPVTATCSASNDGAMQINGTGSWVNTADVVNGDTITLRARCFQAAGIRVITQVYVGSYGTLWNIYTRSAPALADF